MISSRQLALEVLVAVERDDAYANLAFAKLQDRAKLEPRDAAMAQEIAYGALRWKFFYERIIERCAQRSIDQVDKTVELYLLIGIHQLLNMRIPAHAAISETVELSKKELNQGATGFINGVLRRASEKSKEQWQQIIESDTNSRIELLAVRYSHPTWIIKAYEQALALDEREDDLELLLAANNEVAPVNVARLPGFCEESELLGEGLSHGTASPLGFTMQNGNPATIQAIKEGRARVQDQGSQLVALAFEAATPVRAGEQWLDLCAGPGGKASLLAALAKLEGAELTCNEIAPHRADLVRSALKPIDANIYVRTGDGLELGEDAPEAFDRILVDAPCTGLGSLRRKPEARWRKSINDLPQLISLQKGLLESAWKGLKPGGVLVYATCSPHASETVAVIDWAVKSLDGCSLIDAQEVVKQINPELHFKVSRRTAQLWPHVHETDAMFIAILQKQIG